MAITSVERETLNNALIKQLIQKKMKIKNKSIIMYYLRFCKFYHIEADIVEQGEGVRREA